MDTPVIYMPVFRFRQEEKKVLLSRDFSDATFPCIEIIKATEKKARIIDSAQKSKIGKKGKSFDEVYLPSLRKIRAKKVFIDLPVHMKTPRNMQPEVLSFMRAVVSKRNERTEHMLKLAPLKDKIIPVISSYWNQTNEADSIVLQATELRTVFSVLAVRTFPSDLKRDFNQLTRVLTKDDYLIFDILDSYADLNDHSVCNPLIKQIAEEIGCQIIIVRDIVNCEIKNSELKHDEVIQEIISDLNINYKGLHGTAFGDYAGIKKDDVTKGGGISPGFIFYDPIENVYYGYRGNAYEIDGKVTRFLDDFIDVIVPDVIKSKPVKQMLESPIPYLTIQNEGWNILQRINKNDEPGKSQAKFKRISMEHYIHCVEVAIEHGLIK